MPQSNPLYDPGDRPTQDFVAKGLTYMRDTIWRPAWDEWSKVDAYILQTYHVWDLSKHPELVDRPQTTTSTAFARVLHAVNNLMASTPKIHCEPAGTGEVHKDRAERKEKGLSAVMIDAALKEAIPTYRTINLNLVRYDCAVYLGPLLETQIKEPKPRKRSSEDPDDFKLRMEAWEAKREMWNPIRIRAPHPRSVLMDPVDKDPMFAFTTSRKTGYQIARLLAGKRLTREGVSDWDPEGKEFEDFTLVEFWTPFWHWVGLGPKTLTRTEDVGTELYVDPNGPGFLPLKFTWGGRGGEFTDDDEINTAHLGIGLIAPIMPDLLRESQAISSEHNVTVEMGFPKVVAPANTDVAEAAQVFGNGVIPQGFAFMDPPKLVNGIQNRLERDRQKIEEATFTMGLAGFRQSDTVGQEAQLSQAALRGFEMARMSAENITSLVGQDVLRVVEYYGKPIKVRGATLDPKDIERLYQADVTFPVVDPVLRMQEREIVLKEMAAGAASLENFLAVKGIENVQEEMDRIDTDRAHRDEAYIFWINSEVYRKEGLVELSAWAKERYAAIIEERRQQMGMGGLPSGQQQLGGQVGMEDLEAGPETVPGGAASLRTANPGPAQAAAMANGQMKRGMEG